MLAMISIAVAMKQGAEGVSARLEHRLMRSSFDGALYDSRRRR